jgi:hypothetical protein
MTPVVPGRTSTGRPKAPVQPPYSAFVDRAHAPEPAAVRKVLARASAAWDYLAAHLAATYGLRSEIHFMYGERYGWALRFDHGGRLVLAMYPNRGRLAVQVVLNRAQVDAAERMRLPEHVVAALKAAKPYPKERWLFIPVRSRADAGELHSVIALKAGRPTAGRTAGAVKE